MSDSLAEKSCLPFGSLAVQEVTDPQCGYRPSSSQTNSRVRIALALASLVALVFAVYWPALSARFIYLDDTKHILQNSVVTGGITSQGLIAAFRPYASIWTPLTWISHMVVVEFAGLNTEWHHFVNVVLQAVAVLLVFSWILRLTQRFWVSVAVAALFAVHPLNVENVAWVTERNHLLAMVFLLAALHAYTSHVAHVTRLDSANTTRWMRLAELGMLLSIMSKGVFLTFPVLLLILDGWPFGRLRRATLRQLLLEKAGLFAIALFSTIMTLRSLDADATSGEPLSFAFRACVALTNLGWQAIRLAIPYELSPMHSMPQGVLWPEALVSTVALILATFVGWRVRRRMPWVLAGIAWFTVAMLPVSGITQAGNTFFSDRFVYLPQIGIFLAVALSVTFWLSRMRLGPTIGLAALFLVVSAYGATTHWYAGRWKDTATLFTHATAVTKNNFVAHTTAALAFLKKNDLPGALPHFEAGLRINPGAVNFRNYYGETLAALSRYDDAAEQFERVLAAEPAHPGAQFRLATIQLRRGQAGEALAKFRELKARQEKGPPDLDQWIEKAAAQAAGEQPRGSEVPAAISAE